MDVPTLPDLQYLALPDKPDCRIAYTLQTVWQSKGQDVIWLIFVNGLGLPQAFWQPSIQLLQNAITNNDSELGFAKIVATTYDRYGQGFSKIADSGLPKRHDLADAANDLENILEQIRNLHQEELSRARIVLAAHSLGVPLARLYLERKSSLGDSVVGAIFLDSNIANLNMVSVLPDPTSSDFDESKLPADTTIDELKWTRANYERMFAPSAPNPENLDRTSLPALLPHADQPKLNSKIRSDFLLTVIAHDPDAFAMESLKISTRGLTEQYIEPAWHEYNLGLLKLKGRDNEDLGNIVVAAGAGHFIQRDNPQVVAEEIQRVISKICKM